MDEIIIGQIRRHPVLGDLTVIAVHGGTVFVGDSSGKGMCYFEQIVLGWKIIK